MKSSNRALLTTALAVALGGSLVGSASADESGLSSDDSAAEPITAPRYDRAPAIKKRVTSRDGRSGFGLRTAAPRVVLLDESVQQAAPPVPLAADVADQTLAMGLRTEPALAASLVALGCLVSWRRRSKLARRGAWAP